MKSVKRSYLSPQFVIGLVIITFGALFLARNLGYYQVEDIISTYWPILLIVVGIGRVIQPRHGRVFGWLLIIFGIVLQLDALYSLNFNIWDLWPVFLIAVGVKFLSRSWRRSGNDRKHYFSPMEVNDSEDTIKNVAVLSGLKSNVTSKNFMGGEVTAVIGGGQIDFRSAVMSGDEAVLDVFIFMGGLEIAVPREWTVIVNATPIMGGVDDKTVKAPEGNVKRLIITGTIVMGGIDLKNAGLYWDKNPNTVSY